MMKRSFRIAASVLALSAVAAPALANPFESALPNGMKLIVKEDRRAPSVVHMVWYKVGAMDEVDGTSGVAHLLEHMMFKGSRKLGPGEASRILRELGAEENAFTSDDYTAYYQVLARDRLAVALELDADRLASLKLPADEFARELHALRFELTPSGVYLNPTERCNLNCTYCYLPDQQRSEGQHMSAEKLTASLSRLRDYFRTVMPEGRKPRAIFHGAEPLMNREALFAAIDGVPDQYLFLALTVPVDTAITLLHHIGVVRNLQMDEAVTVILQVDAFGGGIGSQQDAHSRFLGRGLEGCFDFLTFVLRDAAM